MSYRCFGTPPTLQCNGVEVEVAGDTRRLGSPERGGDSHRNTKSKHPGQFETAAKLLAADQYGEKIDPPSDGSSCSIDVATMRFRSVGMIPVTTTRSSLSRRW